VAYKNWCIDAQRIIDTTTLTKTEAVSTKQNIDKTVPQIIAQNEGHTIEFKETLEYSVREGKQDKNLNKECLKTIAAFLNTDGGTLLIGVRDNGEITGIERDLPYVQRKNEDGLQLKLRNLIKSNFTPIPSGKIDIRFEKHAKETVCRVDVESAQIIHFGKDVYIRDGNLTRKLEGRDLTDWIQQRGE
jgi:predicted HTH transcriptional regulator